MNTRRILHAVAALFLVGAILSCSSVTNLFAPAAEKPTGQSTSGGEGQSQPTTSAPNGGSQPIVGTWKQIDFQGLAGKRNVFMGDSGIWLDDYYYLGTYTLRQEFAQPQGPSTGAGGAPPPGLAGAGGGGSGGAPQPQGPASSGVGPAPQPQGQGSAGAITPAELWRTRDGTNWEVVGEPGLGNPENFSLGTRLFQDRIYVVAGPKPSLLVSKDGKAFELVNGDWSKQDLISITRYIVGDSLYVFARTRQNGLQAWLSKDGERFDRTIEDGLGNPANTSECGFSDNAFLDGWYYLGVTNQVHGAEVWRTQDGRTWERSLTAGFDDPSNISFCTRLTYKGYVYALSTHKLGSKLGGDVLRTADGKNWERVVQNGFGLGASQGTTSSLRDYKDALYVTLANQDPSSGLPSTGFTLWKSPDGKSWEQIGKPGFGFTNSDRATLFVIRDMFYLVAHNTKDGNQVWRSTDGTKWEQFFTFPASSTNYAGHLEELAGGLEYFEYDMARGIQIWRYGS